LPLYRVYAVTKSDNPLFDNKELVIGRLDPGKSRSATAPAGYCEVKGHKLGSRAPLPKDLTRICSVPKDALMRQDGVKLHFEEARNRAPADTELRVGIKSLERPIFAYSYETIDNRKGNGDGLLQKGEQLTMYLTVKNVGKGRSYETQANLRNLSGEGLLLHDGRFDLSNMMPGDTRHVAFTFDDGPGPYTDLALRKLERAQQRCSVEIGLRSIGHGHRAAHRPRSAAHQPRRRAQGPLAIGQRVRGGRRRQRADRQPSTLREGGGEDRKRAPRQREPEVAVQPSSDELEVVGEDEKHPRRDEGHQAGTDNRDAGKPDRYGAGEPDRGRGP